LDFLENQEKKLNYLVHILSKGKQNKVKSFSSKNKNKKGFRRPPLIKKLDQRLSAHQQQNTNSAITIETKKF
jgi:hypothetical protein